MNQKCKFCDSVVQNSTICSECYKSQRRSQAFSLYFVVLLLLGIFFSRQSKSIPESASEATTATVQEQTTTSSPTASITATAKIMAIEPIFAAPDPESGWVEVQPGIFARRSDNRSDCFRNGNGIEHCAGYPVEYYTTNGRWIVAWENSWSKTKKEIFPGEIRSIYFPSDATNIHWEKAVPGCEDLFAEECLDK